MVKAALTSARGRSGRQGDVSSSVHLIRSIATLAIGYFVGSYHQSLNGHVEMPCTCTCDDNNNKNKNINARDAVAATQHEQDHSMDWIVPADLRDARKMECDGSKVSSTGGFCLTESKNTGGNNFVDRPMGEYLRDNIFAGQTVVDLGAGLGHYGKIFTEPGSPVKSWVGYDGAINVQSATDGLVRFMDLTQPHAADERACVKGDWVLSLEVAEHIPPEHTDSFLRNVRCHARVGAVVSWARPEQRGGLGHVNMRTDEDSKAAMVRWGFVVDEEATQAVRSSATLKHFKKTPTVYRLLNTGDRGNHE